MKPPFAAALTAVLITLAGGPLGLGEAHARAIYTGTFDPEDDNYEWKGTHSFSVSDACLSSNGWRAANTGSSGQFYNLQSDGYTNTYSGYEGGSGEACEAKLLGGSLSLRRKSGSDQGFKTLTFGEQIAALVWGVYVKDGELAGVDTFLVGPLRFTDAEAEILFGDQFFVGKGLSLRWESGKAPISQLPGGLFDGAQSATSTQGVVSSPSYIQSFVDPVYLYEPLGNSDNFRELTPGQSAKDVTFTRVPEPGSVALVGLALAAMVGLSRRRSKGV
jgi:hypothetical protein